MQPDICSLGAFEGWKVLEAWFLKITIRHDIYIQWNTVWRWEGMKGAYYTLQHRWVSETGCWVKDDTWEQILQGSTDMKCPEMANPERQKIAECLLEAGGGSTGEWLLRVQGCFMEWWSCFQIRLWWWLYHAVNWLKTALDRTLKKVNFLCKLSSKASPAPLPEKENMYNWMAEREGECAVLVNMTRNSPQCL